MKKTKSTYLALVVLLSPMAANADLVAITGACPEAAAETCFTGAQGLDVNGAIYDMSFVEGSYADVFASDPGVALFDGDFALATVVAQLLEDAFRAVGFFPTQYAGGPNGGWAGADLAYAGSSGSLLIFTSLDVDFFSVSRPIVANWMVFTPATSVPEPGTLALFGLGLAAMGFTRRRRKV